jgi:hypothetical protein
VLKLKAPRQNSEALRHTSLILAKNSSHYRNYVQVSRGHAIAQGVRRRILTEFNTMVSCVRYMVDILAWISLRVLLFCTNNYRSTNSSFSHLLSPLFCRVTCSTKELNSYLILKSKRKIYCDLRWGAVSPACMRVSRIPPV